MGEDGKKGVVAFRYEGFGVELDSYDAFGIALFDGFDNTVLRDCGNYKSWSNILYCLMMGCVYSCCFTENAVQDSAFCDPDGVHDFAARADTVIYECIRQLGWNVLVQCAAECDIQHLGTAAYSQDR